MCQSCVQGLTNLLCDGAANAHQMVKAGGVRALEVALKVTYNPQASAIVAAT